MSIYFEVFDTPAPQGSKRHVGNGRMVEMSKRVKPWREAVKYAALEIAGEPLNGPLSVAIDFFLPRPKGHFRSGANAHLLRNGAPTHPATRPDLDKLARSTLDALTAAGVYGDDSQVVQLHVSKHYRDRPGAEVSVSPLVPSVCDPNALTGTCRFDHDHDEEQR